MLWDAPKDVLGMLDLESRRRAPVAALLVPLAALSFAVVALACGASGRGNAGDLTDPMDSGGGAIDGGQAPFAEAGPQGTCHATGDVATQLLSRGASVGLPRLAWSGTRYAAIWYDASRAAGAFDVYFAFASEDGVLDASTVRMVSPARGAFARIAFSGTEYGVVYQGGMDARGYFLRVGANGEVIPGSNVEISGPNASSFPAIAWNPVRSEWGVAWTEHVSIGLDVVHFSRLDVHGMPIANSRLSVSDPSVGASLTDSGNSPLLWNGSRFAMAYSRASAAGGLYVAEIDGAGTLARQIPVGRDTPHAMRATLAWSGSGYGVAWMSTLAMPYTTLFGRIGSDGVYVAASEIAIGTAGVYSGEPSVASRGTEYAVAWDEQPSGGQIDLWVTRISTSGEVLSKAARIATPSFEWWPEIGWNGCRYALVYNFGALQQDQSRANVLLFGEAPPPPPPLR